MDSGKLNNRINWYKSSMQVSRGMYASMFLDFNEEIKYKEKTLEEALNSIGERKSKYSNDVAELSKLGYKVPLLQGQLDAYEMLN